MSVNVMERPVRLKNIEARAILAGRKTVLRRAVRPVRGYEDFANCRPDKAAASHAVWWHGPLETVGAMQDCPYGEPGGRLWVREAWVADAQVDAIAPRDLSQGEPIQYPADGAVRQTGCSMVTPGKTRPSIHMPRWASRILLEVTDVRVERLQDISVEQAKAEGVRLYTDHAELGDWWHVEGIETYSADPRKSFELLWSSINNADAWAANPWVWVIEFQRVLP